jgi:hypothetical protein
MGLPSRSATLETTVWSSQLGTQELQLSGYEHEEAQHGLLCPAAHARVIPYCQPGRRHVVQLACRPEVTLSLA